MIVPMRKATILFKTGDAETTIKSVRSLGLLHVEHQNRPESREISRLMENVSRIDSSLDILNQETGSDKKTQPQEKITGDWMAVVTHIIELGRYLEELKTSSSHLTSQIKEWEPWGDIDSVQIENLNQNGIYLKLCKVPVKEIETFPEDVIVKTIFTSKDTVSCVAISRRQFECPFVEILPPKQGLSLLKSQVAENKATLAKTKEEIIYSAIFWDDLSGIRKKLGKEIELQQVISGMGKGGDISYITGYIPSDQEGQLIAEVKSRKWGIMITDPSEDDDVPTLLQNPRWVRMIQPVLNLLGLTPGYQELDISMWFLVFFSLFFGILIGDAGYGLVYIILTLLVMIWFHKKGRLNAEMKTMGSLVCLLGSCAAIWGVLTGTFFGPGWLVPLVPQLNDANTMESFCFFLGAFQLSIAHVWRAILKFPSLKVLADVGYICILWTAFFLARTLVLGEPFPSFGLWLVGTGIALVILFTNPQPRVLRGIGEGLGAIALGFMNNITDVISYVRLFAVGLAGLAISETTNTLASGFGDGLVAVMAGVVILIIGHSLNIILGIISVLVHGVRLNVLEFSGHANVSWSGTPFEPLKE